MDQHAKRLRRIVRIASLLSFVGGALVLAGWWFEVPTLSSFATGLVAMNPATALMFIAAAAGLYFETTTVRLQQSGLLKRIFGSVLITGGGLVLLAFLGDWQTGFDRILFSASLGENRMAPNTAVYFICIGLAFWTLNSSKRGNRLSQAMAFVVAGGAVMSLLGYGYGARNLYGVGNYIPMALNTTVLFAAVAAGLLCLQGNHGLFSVLKGPDSGSAMARQLLPIAVTVPCLLGFLRVLGQQAGWYDTEFGAALMVLVTVVLLVIAVLLSANALNRTDAQRRLAESAIRQLNGSLERRVDERTAELAEVNRDLTHKNQENEMFVYSVSHDLRSPLVNLQGFSKELEAVTEDLRTILADPAVPEQIRTRAVALLDGDIDQSLHFIQAAVSRLGNIIDALLRLSRVGRIEYQCGLVDVQHVVTRVIESMSGDLYDAGIEVDLRDLPPCYGDGTAVEQLFANLIGNAIKYRRPDGESRIEVGVLPEEPPATAGKSRTYYVQDNGLGIPAAHQEKIFQAFKRAHPRAAPGDGMGLAIVRRIVQRHNGSAWVQSEEGQGSTFFISLPITASKCIVHSNLTNSHSGEQQHGSGTNGHLVGGRR